MKVITDFLYLGIPISKQCVDIMAFIFFHLAQKRYTNKHSGNLEDGKIHLIFKDPFERWQIERLA